LPAPSKVQKTGKTKVGSQTTDSEEHPGWRKRLKDNPSHQDVGGDFWTQKRYAHGKASYVSVESGDLPYSGCIARRVKYTGPVWAIDAGAYPFPPSESSTATQLDQLGATAIARCKPTNSAANIGVAIGELVREGIPKLVTQSWQRRASDLKGLGSEHLNYQFGLKPLGQEIGTFAYQVTQADRLLRQYERDAERVVRRSYRFPPKHTVELVQDLALSDEPYYGGAETGLMNPDLPASERKKLEVTKTISQERWFTGTFIYYLPRGYDARNEMDRKALLAKEILGLDLDLETIWNLAPWSWAVDWFSNAGDVISNVNDFLEDGLVMPYGYMMEHTIVSYQYTRKFQNLMRSGSIDSHVTLVTETKMRRKANPFGFGVSWSGLSKLQYSILAALGITRKK